MTRKAISNPENVAKPLKEYYSNAVKVSSGPLLFISGQVALNREGCLIGERDLRAQAVQVLENIREILAANGGSMRDVVKVTVYVRDIRAFDEIEDIRLRYFRDEPPASAIIEVSQLAHPEMLIEIEAVAAV